MTTVCSTCGTYFERGSNCPSCAVSSSFAGPQSAPPALSVGVGWQHSALGRIAFGLVFAQGLALGLRMFNSAGLVAEPIPDDAGVWPILSELLLRQGLESACVVVACVLAAAGQRRGLIIGAIIGVVHSAILQAIARVQGSPVDGFALYAQPVLNGFLGGFAGLLGGLIWRPLPVLNLAPAGVKTSKRASATTSLFAGPIAWFRVILGTTIVVAGVLSPTALLDFVARNSQGQLQLSSQLQSTLVTWELVGLFILLGSGVAGFGTRNGPKQGICVGVASSLMLVGVQLSRPSLILEELLFSAFVIVSLSLVGGWFACRLFPPVLPYRRHRPSESP